MRASDTLAHIRQAKWPISMRRQWGTVMQVTHNRTHPSNRHYNVPFEFRNLFIILSLFCLQTICIDRCMTSAFCIRIRAMCMCVL